MIRSRRPQPEPTEKQITDPRILQTLSRYCELKKIRCARVFDAAHELQMSPQEVLDALGEMDVQISHCQCGLFGFPPPEKKRIKPLFPISPKLEEEIRQAVYEGGVPCVDVWRIADKLKKSRLTVSCGCETLGISIKPCQLGCF